MKVRYEARRARGTSRWATWKLVRVREVCCGCAGCMGTREEVDILAYAYYLMSPEEQEGAMRAAADALNKAQDGRG